MCIYLNLMILIKIIRGFIRAKQFFMDVAAGLCEGDGPLPEKRPVILEAQDVLITYRGKLPGIITGSLKTPPLA